LLAGVSACGSDDATDSAAAPADSRSASASPSGSDSPTDAPPPAWKQDPGQADKALKTWVDAHLTPTGSAIAHIDGRRVRIRSYFATEWQTARIQISIANEKVGLEEK
jgi:hypothetical protein